MGMDFLVISRPTLNAAKNIMDIYLSAKPTPAESATGISHFFVTNNGPDG